MMAQYIERGCAEKATENSIRFLFCYFPHQPVSHPKKHNKLRIVFDCVAQYAGTSLNENLHSGPDLADDLVDVLTRFPPRTIELTADIEATFHGVIVPPIDRNALRYIWWP